MNYYLIEQFVGPNTPVPQIQEEPTLNLLTSKKVFKLSRYATFSDYIDYVDCRVRIVSDRMFEIMKLNGYPDRSDNWEHIDLLGEGRVVKNYVSLKPPTLSLELIDFPSSTFIAKDMLQRIPDAKVQFSSLDEYLSTVKTKDTMMRILPIALATEEGIGSPWITTALPIAYHYVSESLICQLQDLEFTGFKINEQIRIHIYEG